MCSALLTGLPVVCRVGMQRQWAGGRGMSLLLHMTMTKSIPDPVHSAGARGPPFHLPIPISDGVT